MTPIVHIVDDDKSFRIAMSRLVEALGYRAADYGSGEELLSSMLSDVPGCILLDLQMPGVDGLELQERLGAVAPLLPIVFLTGQGDIESCVQAMKAGAEDFLQKTAPGQALREAIERALLRNERRRAEHDRASTLRELVESLTRREAQVFDLVVHGKRNKEIAFALGTSERTVKAHRRSIMEKLQVRSLAEAVSIAEQLNLMGAGARPLDR